MTYLVSFTTPNDGPPGAVYVRSFDDRTDAALFIASRCHLPPDVINLSVMMITDRAQTCNHYSQRIAANIILTVLRDPSTLGA